MLSLQNYCWINSSITKNASSTWIQLPLWQSPACFTYQLQYFVPKMVQPLEIRVPWLNRSLLDFLHLWASIRVCHWLIRVWPCSCAIGYAYRPSSAQDTRYLPLSYAYCLGLIRVWAEACFASQTRSAYGTRVRILHTWNHAGHTRMLVSHTRMGREIPLAWPPSMMRLGGAAGPYAYDPCLYAYGQRFDFSSLFRCFVRSFCLFIEFLSSGTCICTYPHQKP